MIKIFVVPHKSSVGKYSSIAVEPGEHEIELQYCGPGKDSLDVLDKINFKMFYKAGHHYIISYELTPIHELLYKLDTMMTDTKHFEKLDDWFYSHPIGFTYRYVCVTDTTMREILYSWNNDAIKQPFFCKFNDVYYPHCEWIDSIIRSAPPKVYARRPYAKWTIENMWLSEIRDIYSKFLLDEGYEIKLMNCIYSSCIMELLYPLCGELATKKIIITIERKIAGRDERFQVKMWIYNKSKSQWEIESDHVELEKLQNKFYDYYKKEITFL